MSDGEVRDLEAGGFEPLTTVEIDAKVSSAGVLGVSWSVKMQMPTAEMLQVKVAESSLYYHDPSEQGKRAKETFDRLVTHTMDQAANVKASYPREIEKYERVQADLEARRLARIAMQEAEKAAREQAEREANLSPEERQTIADLRAQGLSNAEIAATMAIADLDAEADTLEGSGEE